MSRMITLHVYIHIFNILIYWLYIDNIFIYIYYILIIYLYIYILILIRNIYIYILLHFIYYITCFHWSLFSFIHLDSTKQWQMVVIGSLCFPVCCQTEELAFEPPLTNNQQPTPSTSTSNTDPKTPTPDEHAAPQEPEKIALSVVDEPPPRMRSDVHPRQLFNNQPRRSTCEGNPPRPFSPKITGKSHD